MIEEKKRDDLLADMPQDKMAEECVIAAVLNNPALFEKIGTIQSCDFYFETNQKIFQSLLEMRSSGVPIDVITLSDELLRRNQLDKVGGRYFLTGLMTNNFLSGENIDRYVRIIQEKSRKRRRVACAYRLSEVSKNGASEDEFIGILEDLNKTRDEDWQDNQYFKQCKSLADALAPRERFPSVVEGIVPARSLSIWYGSPGSLKSNLLIDMSFDIAKGGRWLSGLPSKDDFVGFATSAGPTLWVDIDNGNDVMAERLAAFARARESPDAPVNWLSFPTPALSAANGLDDLVVCVKKINPRFIVIDNLLRVSGVRDENSNEIDVAMANLRKLVEATNSAVAVIHHRRKDSSSSGREGDSIRGHSSIEGAVDAAFLLKREEGSDIVTIQNTKARRRPVESFSALWTFELEDDGETLRSARFFRTELYDVKLRIELELRNRILKVLAAGPKNTRSLLSAVRGRRESVYRVLDALEESKQVKVEDGKHGARIYSRVL